MADWDESHTNQNADPKKKDGGSQGDNASPDANTSDRAQDGPSLNLPKGGGAIRGIGEKFSVSALTGTGSMTIPVFTSPGRSDFSPKLSLNYDSGSGNGLFGIGWSLSIPSVTRKTDKGLPRYDDASESDVFIFSGAEDLVPVLTLQAGLWKAGITNGTTPDNTVYNIKRYRPRSEGLFAKIEQWQRQIDGDIHWRATTKDNVTNIYGLGVGARIADPSDATHVFKWLLESTFDDKGNVMFYVYKPEDNTGMDLTSANEQNRINGNAPFANTYLKRIFYGNQTLYNSGEDLTKRNDWLFEVVMDYGDHNKTKPVPAPGPGLAWITRADPFSSFKSGFEVRNYRLCQRILMFHHFQAVSNLQGYDGLVRTTDLVYDQADPLSLRIGNPVATRLLSVTQTGYSPDTAAPNNYITKSFPPVSFTYSEAQIDSTVYSVDPQSLENAPAGLAGTGYQWIDLDGEGSAGILYQTAAGLYYKRNSSPANTTIVNGIERALAKLKAQELVSYQPGLVLAGGQTQFMDLAGDGHQDMVSLKRAAPGFYRRSDDDGWESFSVFDSFPNLDTRDPNVKFIDVDGDGLTDILVSEDEVMSWNMSLGAEGFGAREYARKPFDEEKGPALVFADPTQSIFLGDMSGDGLTDIIRIRSGEVCYWPNKGYGRFGAKVTMDNAPVFDTPDLVDATQVRHGDIDGSGTTDILYLRSDGVTYYFNQSGNSWTDELILTNLPAINDRSTVSVLDLLGNGMSCLVWSSPLGSDVGAPMKYIDLMGGQKPHLLTGITNGLGAETRLRYTSSSKFYVEDRDAGTPWVTRLAFPVYVVERMEVFDYIGRTRLVSTYRYRHGYFDGVEREFRGFGYVEQRDAESFGDTASLFTEDTDVEADALHAPPVIIKTWFHTGAWPDRNTVILQMAKEYFVTAGQTSLPDTVLPIDILLPDSSRLPYSLTGDETREAVRSLKGNILRQEIYSAGTGAITSLPYTVSSRNYTIETLQPQSGNRNGVFFTHARETIDYQYERIINDPRVVHMIVTDVDPFGNMLRSVHASYARNMNFAGLILAPAIAPGTEPDITVDPSIYAQPEQLRPLFTIIENTFTSVIDSATAYRTPMIIENFKYELTRPARPDETVPYIFSDLKGLAVAALIIPFETTPDLTKIQKRLFEDIRTYYLKDDLTPLPFGQIDSLGLVYETYQLALTTGLAQQVFITANSNPNKPANTVALNNIISGEGAYVNLLADGNWWIPSGRTIYSIAQLFYLPQSLLDPFGQSTKLGYDPYNLLLVQIQDPLNNTTIAQQDYRTLQPTVITDPNNNVSAAMFDSLGMVIALAVEGKITIPPATESGDALTNFDLNPTQATIDNFFNAPDPRTLAPALLGNATIRIINDLHHFINTQSANPADPTKWEPVYAVSIERETHVGELTPGQQSAIQLNFSYSDGLGNEIQKKIPAEPGPLDLTVPKSPVVSPRWVGSGWEILNNKNKPVRKYEPFFSATHHFEFANKVGVTSTVFYDPLQRVIAVSHPDHSWGKIQFTPWMQKVWDGNDTVQMNPKTDPDVGKLFSLLPDGDYLPVWYDIHTAGAAPAWQKDAANKTTAHNNTPYVTLFDNLGRGFLTIENNALQFYSTRKQMDIQGDPVIVTDALGRIAVRYDYDLLKKNIHQTSMEAGERWTLDSVVRKPIRLWDNRGFMRTIKYDELQRPASLTVADNAFNSVLGEKIVYGDSKVGAPANPTQSNQLTRIYQSYDSAGIITNEVFDFKGNLIRNNRQLLSGTAYRNLADWNLNNALGETFTGTTFFDALNRITQQVAPNSNQPGTKINILQPTYNEANLLEKVDAWTQQGAEPAALLDPNTATIHAVTNIDYNAKGQRILIEFGIVIGGQSAQVNTSYQYDPETFLLTNLITTRKSDSVLLQNLFYYYDPSGNITHIEDDADIQNTVYFKNKRVEPGVDYTFDAIYRLTKAAGREHLGQTGNTPNAPTPQSYNDWPNINLPDPGDGNAMGTYIENFIYDPSGNMQKIQHMGSDPANPGWTRTFTYNETSMLEPVRQNNCLTSTTIGGTTETYSVGGNGYDLHGNMLTLPQLQIIQWDFKDQLQMTQRQRVNIDDTDGAQHTRERTYYVYDSSGQRIRKVTESQQGIAAKERIYMGSFEVYREYDNTGATTLERETLQIMDDKHRVAVVESRTKGDDDTPLQLIRYQFGNHLGSACLELDDGGTVISYEEYYPYGSTSYQAVETGMKIAAKHYRYIGKERDEETGFYYCGARYYTPWLARWINTDPAGLIDGPNLYRYGRNNPVKFIDTNGTDSKHASGHKQPPGNKPSKHKKVVEHGKSNPNIAIGKHLHLLDPPSENPEPEAYLAIVKHLDLDDDPNTEKPQEKGKEKDRVKIKKPDPPSPVDVNASVQTGVDTQSRNAITQTTITVQSANALIELKKPEILKDEPDRQIKIGFITFQFQAQNQQTVPVAPGPKTQVEQNSASIGATAVTVSVGAGDKSKAIFSILTVSVGVQTSKTTAYGPTGPPSLSGTQAVIGIGILQAEVPLFELKPSNPLAGPQGLKVSLVGNAGVNITKDPGATDPSQRTTTSFQATAGIGAHF